MVTQEQLLEAALARAGGNKRRLSRETGLPYDYVQRWTAGGTGMRADAAIALLEYVGWLRVGEEAGPDRGHSGGASEASTTPAPPGSVPAEVAAQALADAAEALLETARGLSGRVGAQSQSA